MGAETGGGLPALLALVQARVEERFPADLERIRAYLRTPSVSATGEGVRETAAATAAWAEAAGGRAELVETGGHPPVLGELPGPPGAPRLVRYGMYDVQPAEGPGWTSPPFAAEVVARGSANSKGCLAGLFVAVEVLRELGMLPVTVALLVEGEERLGSPHLAAAARAHKGDLAAEAAFDYPWAKAPPGNRAARALGAACDALGLRPLPYPMAPWCAPYFVFDRVLGLPWAAGGAGHAGGAHGPDEYATLAGLKEHIVSVAAFLLAYAAEPAAPARRAAA